MDEQALFAQTGYRLVPSLFSEAEVDRYCEYFMDLRARPCTNDEVELDLTSEDPLVRYPRIMMPQRWDQLSMAFMLEPRIDAWLTNLLGVSPIAVQTMVYFKPPGARGQALHQDNFYLLASPGTCAAAWLALDECDEENGCMSVVPGSHDAPVLCIEDADTSVSFTDVIVPVPPGLEAVPMRMKRGDVLFFNGQIIHGSGPNSSQTRFRRSLIGHYIEACATEVTEYCFPAYWMDGREADLKVAEGGDMCGRFVEGKLEMVSGGHRAGRVH